MTHQKLTTARLNTHTQRERDRPTDRDTERQTHRQWCSGICGLNHGRKTGDKVAARSDQSRTRLCPLLQHEPDPVSKTSKESYCQIDVAS